MNIGAALQSMVHQQIRRFGDALEITLRERSTLRNRASGTPTNSLTLVVAASAGGLEVVAEAANLIGALPAGAKVTAGAVQYTLASAAEATVASTQITLTLTTVLTGNLAAGASVDISQPYADTTYTAMRSRVDQKEVANGIPDTARSYRLSAHAQTRTPKKGDVLVDSTGNATELVSRVDGATPGATAIYWTVFVGSAS